MQAMEQIQLQNLQMEEANRAAQPQPMEGGGMQPGQPMSPEMMMQQQKTLDPMQVITDIVFQALNPQKQGLGNVQKRQEGLPQEGM
jgi:hypothetical protein